MVTYSKSYFLILVGRKMDGIQGGTSSTKGLSLFPPSWQEGITQALPTGRGGSLFCYTKAFSPLQVDWPDIALLS